MKQLLLLFGICGLLAACNSAEKKAAENVALIERYVEAVENLNHELMDSFLAEDY